MKRNIILLFIFSVTFNLNAQFTEDYIPHKYTGKIPVEFLFEPEKEITESANNQSIFTPDEAEFFFRIANYEKKALFMEGTVYFNDELTKFVNSVADELLKSNSKLRTQIKIYVTKYIESNAYALPDGSIFINIGTLSCIENESQLAFILAHEIAHFEKQHSIMNYKKNIQLAKHEHLNGILNEVIRGTIYSKENEFEADLIAMDYLLSSDYDAFESLKALRILNDSLLEKYNTKINLKEYFGDSIKIMNPLGFVSSNKGQNKDSDDLYHTHPIIEKRINAINEYLKIKGYSNEGKQLNKVHQDNFAKINTISVFESIYNYYEFSNYGISLYLTFQLLNQFPQNHYLQLMVIKNLYWISFYKNTDNLEDILKYEILEYKKEYQKMTRTFMNMNSNDLNKILYDFTQKRSTDLNQHESFYIYNILIQCR